MRLKKTPLRLIPDELMYCETTAFIAQSSSITAFGSPVVPPVCASRHILCGSFVKRISGCFFAACKKAAHFRTMGQVFEGVLLFLVFKW